MPYEIAAAVFAEPSDERRVLEKAIEHGIEFGGVLVIQASVASQGLTEQHVTPRVGYYGPAECPGFERNHRKTFCRGTASRGLLRRPLR